MEPDADLVRRVAASVPGLRDVVVELQGTSGQLIARTDDASAAVAPTIAALEAAGVRMLDLEGPDYQILVEALAARGLSSLIVEGGRRVATAFLAQGLVDRIMLFTSDILVGEGGVASPIAPEAIPSEFRLRSSARFGADRLLEYMKA